MTLANYVTFSRIILIPLVVSLLLNGLNGLALIIFLLLSSSDAIDGYLARRFNQVSDLGKFLDPLADKVLVISVLITLVGLGQVSAVPVIIITARELLVQALRIQIASQKQQIIAANFLAKGKTGLQILAIAMLMLSLPLANLALWLAVLLSLISGGNYLWQNKN